MTELPKNDEAASPDRAETPPGPDRLVRRETAALDALRALIRDHYLQEFGSTPPAKSDVRIRLDLAANPLERLTVELLHLAAPKADDVGVFLL